MTEPLLEKPSPQALREAMERAWRGRIVIDHFKPACWVTDWHVQSMCIGGHHLPIREVKQHNN